MNQIFSFEDVKPYFRGKRVALVGSGPGVLDNPPGLIDAYDVVVRVNNYKLSPAAGKRTDVHYSFYGSSIRKSAEELREDGCTLCMCKCPDSQPIVCDWHVLHNKMAGIDFRYIYSARRDWWPCAYFIPDDEHFLRGFELLARHVPTTGFSAILDILACEPALLYLTGFDFFSSGVHNVDEKWRAGNPEDPIGHVPEREALWIVENAERYPLSFDRRLKEIVARGPVGCA